MGEERDEELSEVAEQNEACAHCGTQGPPSRVTLCRDCQFVYCADCAHPDEHECVLVCRECVELEA